jgi:branched-chain amino acid transport system substrate-binding protein
MRKLALFLIALTVIAGCSKPKPDSSVITIGIFGDFGNKYGKYADEMKKAVELAVMNQNRKGGVFGKKIRLLSEDVPDIRDYVKAIDRFTFAKCDAVICAGGSDIALSVTIKCETARMTMLCPGLSEHDLPGKGDFTIPLLPDRGSVSVAASDFILNNIHARKGAVFYNRTDESFSLTQPFQTAFGSPLKKNLTFFTISRGEKNFASFAKETAAAKPQFVYLAVQKEQLHLILGSLKQENISVPVISAYDLSDPVIISDTAQLPDKTYYMKYIGANDDAGVFGRDFKVKNGSDPGSFALSAYDSYQLILDAYGKTTSEGKIPNDPLEFRKNIAHARNFKGASGSISFSKNGAAYRDIGVFTFVKGSVQKKAVYSLNENDMLKEQK